MIPLAIVLQVVTPPPADTSTFATKTEVQTVQQAAQAAQAAVPGPCNTVPMQDTLTGSVGAGTPCTTRPDATRPTVIQAKTATTAADATYSVTFDQPFATAPIYVDARVTGQAQPYLCTVTTWSATGASGKCFQLVATTLPVVSTSLLGLVVSPFVNAAAGLNVRVVARQ